MIKDEVEAWCKEKGNMLHFEISGKDSDIVDQAFQIIAKAASGQPKEALSTINLRSKHDQGSKCCL